MTYQLFFESLRPVCEHGAMLWGRQMVLGPTPEFCLHAPRHIPVPYPVLNIGLEAFFEQEARER
jgi:hypothetical protein